MSGTLSGHIDAVYQGFTSPLAGSGSLYVTTVGKRASPVTMSGSGVLSGATVAQRNSAPAPSGAGALSNAWYQKYFANLVLASAGSLTAGTIPGILGALTGAGALTATAISLTPVVARLGAGEGGRNAGNGVTFNSPNIVVSDANTVVVVGVVISINGSSGSTSPAATPTYGGTTMTELVFYRYGRSTSRVGIGLYYVFHPPTGIQPVFVQPGSTSSPVIQTQAQAVAFSGVSAIGSYQGPSAGSTTHAPTSVDHGYDVRVLSNESALSAPNQTQEYLGGASDAGYGDYMCMQSAAGTGSAINFTCSGTATTTTQSMAVALSPMP